ncbi:unnamed protein product, partial [marine sediment metagenome]
IKTSKLELTTVVIELTDFDQAIEVVKDLVQKQGVQSIHLCPGFPNQAVARVASAVGGRAAVHVSRGDIPGTNMVSEILGKEGWFNEEG